MLLLWSEPESLPACPIFTSVCVSGPAVSPVGWVVRSVLYKPDKFHGGASFRLNFSELSLSWNSDSKFTDIPTQLLFLRGLAFHLFCFPSLLAVAGGGAVKVPARMSESECQPVLRLSEADSEPYRDPAVQVLPGLYQGVCCHRVTPHSVFVSLLVVPGFFLDVPVV